jgi:hypothetical protein
MYYTAHNTHSLSISISIQLFQIRILMAVAEVRSAVGREDYRENGKSNKGASFISIIGKSSIPGLLYIFRRGAKRQD